MLFFLSYQHVVVQNKKKSNLLLAACYSSFYPPAANPENSISHDHPLTNYKWKLRPIRLELKVHPSPPKKKKFQRSNEQVVVSDMAYDASQMSSVQHVCVCVCVFLSVWLMNVGGGAAKNTEKGGHVLPNLKKRRAGGRE